MGSSPTHDVRFFVAVTVVPPTTSLTGEVLKVRVTFLASKRWTTVPMSPFE